MRGVNCSRGSGGEEEEQAARRRSAWRRESPVMSFSARRVLLLALAATASAIPHHRLPSGGGVAHAGFAKRLPNQRAIEEHSGEVRHTSHGRPAAPAATKDFPADGKLVSGTASAEQRYLAAAALLHLDEHGQKPAAAAAKRRPWEWPPRVRWCAAAALAHAAAAAGAGAAAAAAAALAPAPAAALNLAVSQAPVGADEGARRRPLRLTLRVQS